MEENEFNLENNDEYCWIKGNSENSPEQQDLEYEKIKKKYPNKKIGLDLFSQIFSPVIYEDFSKYSIVKINYLHQNNLIFKSCRFKGLLIFEYISSSAIIFENCIFLDILEIQIGKIENNKSNNGDLSIKFDKNISSKDIKLIINSDSKIVLEMQQINLFDSIISCSSINIQNSDCKILNSAFYGSIINENSNIEFIPKIQNNICSQLSVGGMASVKFDNSTIENLVCSQGAKSIEFSNTTITNSTFNGEITDKAIFNNVTFKNPPEIGDIKFKNCNVEFRDVKFLDTHSPQAIAGFRALNKACRDANYHHGEIFFHGLELETRFNMLVERSYLFKCFLKINNAVEDHFLKNAKPANLNNDVKKKNNLSNGDNNIKVIQQNSLKINKKIYYKVINSIKNFLSIFLRKILLFLKKIFQLIANFINHFSYFLISFFFISKDGIERFLLSFHKLFSDFGRSLLLPLFWLVVFAIVVWNLSFIQINSSNNITENLIDKECESAKINVNELPKISKKITFKNSIGPLQLALPKQFISDNEIECYHHKANFFIDSLNFIHAVISYAIWFVWFFMIRARFRL